MSSEVDRYASKALGDAPKLYKYKGVRVDDTDALTPKVFDKYGCVERCPLDQRPLLEFVQYFRDNDHFRQRLLEDPELVNRRDPTPTRSYNHYRSSDTRTDPTTIRTAKLSTVFYDQDGNPEPKNIYNIINVLLSRYGTAAQFSAEGWEKISQESKWGLLCDAARMLVSLVQQLHEKPNRRHTLIVKMKTIVKGNGRQRAQRHIILWKTVATYIRSRMRQYPVTFDYLACKYIADHHPRALHFKNFSAGSFPAYYPRIEESDTTVIHADNVRKPGYYVLSWTELDRLPPYFKDYCNWLRKFRPLKRSETLEEVGVVNDRYRPPEDILRECVTHVSGLPTEDQQNYQSFLEDFQQISPAFPMVALYNVAQTLGVEIQDKPFFGTKVKPLTAPKEKKVKNSFTFDGTHYTLTPEELEYVEGNPEQVEDLVTRFRTIQDILDATPLTSKEELEAIFEQPGAKENFFSPMVGRREQSDMLSQILMK